MVAEPAAWRSISGKPFSSAWKNSCDVTSPAFTLAVSVPEVGLVVRIRCADALSSYDVPGRYFLHEDGRFYAIEPPTLVEAKVTHWVKG